MSLGSVVRSSNANKYLKKQCAIDLQTDNSTLNCRQEDEAETEDGKRETAWV